MSAVRYQTRDGHLFATYEDGTVADFGDMHEPFKAVWAKRPSDGEMMVCTLADETWATLRAQLEYQVDSRPKEIG